MSALDDFQAQLLTALDEGGESATIVERAQAVAPDAEFAAWIAQWEPALVELAVELVQTWAPRDETRVTR